MLGMLGKFIFGKDKNTMKYRKLGKTGLEVSEIGMGLEHLLDKDQSLVTETIRTAVNGGVNYFDCLSLKDFGEPSSINEQFTKLGNALEGVRDKVYITYIANALHSVADTELGFECFLRELKTNHADIFMIACCDKMTEFERVTGNESLLSYARRLRGEGKAGYIGLSTHSSEVAYKTIGSGEFDVMMYPVNPAFDVVDDEEKYISDNLGKLWDAAYDYNSDGKDSAPRRSVYSECERREIGLVAMKPFAGGFIFGVEKDAGFTPLNLLSYALTQNGVSTVVPGCSNQREIEEILTYYTCSGDALDYSDAVAKSRWSVKGNCLYCNHCLPCSANIDIAKINKLADSVTAKDGVVPDNIMKKYASLTANASSCVKCGGCEKKCPFQVEIIKKMERTAAIFTL